MPVSSTQPVISSNLKGAVSVTNENVSPSKSNWWTKQKGKRKHSDSEGSDSSYIDSGDDAENYLKASPVKADKLEALSPDKIVSRGFLYEGVFCKGYQRYESASEQNRSKTSTFNSS